jgi:hypothetical protein
VSGFMANGGPSSLHAKRLPLKYTMFVFAVERM